MEKKEKIKYSLWFLGLMLAFLGFADNAAAATLYLSPSSGSYAVGDTLSVGIYVSSADQTMNAVSGVISFPPDKLEVASLSKNGSIFSLWVQEPSYSDSVGTANFEGIVLNPGFTGSKGKILNITFGIKAAGVATVAFSSASVLANDGKGTNILSSFEEASFQIGVVRQEAPEITTPSGSTGTPPAPEISSLTHPDPNKWYAQSTGKFTWSVPNNATSVRLLVGKIPQAVPNVLYAPPIDNKEVTDLADGVYYFHVQLRNAQGWGAISHFRFQTDTKVPEPFSIKFTDGKLAENPQPTIIVDAVDTTSGIDYYKIIVGDFEETTKTGIYTLPVQKPGKHNILIQAFDKAGNYTAAVDEFIIKPLAAPEITEYPRKLESGTILIIKGQTKYPNSQVVVWRQRENEEAVRQNVKSYDDGKFVFVADEKLKDGIYKLWAEVINNQGAQSTTTEKFTIAVEQPALFRIGSWAISFFAVIIPLIALILLLILILWYSWHKFSLMRRKVKEETLQAEQALHKAFYLLKEEVSEQIKLLEKVKSKRELTLEESKIMEQLKKDLDEAEEFVKKEIEDIEKEIK